MFWLLVIISAALIYFFSRSVLLAHKITELLKVSKDSIDTVAKAAEEAIASERIKTADIAARYEEMRKVPQLACMTDQQVNVLAEMLAIHIRDIVNRDDEYVN